MTEKPFFQNEINKSRNDGLLKLWFKIQSKVKSFTKLYFKPENDFIK